MIYRIVALGILACATACSREKEATKKPDSSDLAPIERMAALNTNFVKMLLVENWPAHAHDYAQYLAEGCQKDKDAELSMRSLEAGNAALIRFGPDRPLTERQALAIGHLFIEAGSVKDAVLLMSKEHPASGEISTDELESLYSIVTEECKKRGLKRNKETEVFEWQR